MNPRIVFSSLRHRGLVKSVRRQYHIFESAQDYVVVSPGRGAGGNYTIVPKKALDYLVRRLGRRKSVTSAIAYEACRRSKFFKDRFTVLNALYVLVGTGAARIARTAAPLSFDIRKRAS